MTLHMTARCQRRAAPAIWEPACGVLPESGAARLTMRGSYSMAMTRFAAASSLTVRLPVPGPISSTMSVLFTPAFSMMLSTTSGFFRMCWPFDLWNSIVCTPFRDASPPAACLTAFLAIPPAALSALPALEDMLTKDGEGWGWGMVRRCRESRQSVVACGWHGPLCVCVCVSVVVSGLATVTGLPPLQPTLKFIAGFFASELASRGSCSSGRCPAHNAGVPLPQAEGLCR